MTGFSRHLRGALLLLFCSLLTFVCSMDSQVKNQGFLTQGNRDFQQGKYPQAMISYGRVLKTDPRSSEAHHKLAQTHMKMESFAAAHQELLRTIVYNRRTPWRATIWPTY